MTPTTLTKEEWKETTLGKVGVQLQHGYTFPSGDLQATGELPVIRIGNVQRGRIVVDENIRYAGNLSTDQLSKQVVNYGDILIALTGGDESNLETSTGRVGRYGIKTPALLNQRVAKIIPSEHLDADFLFYLFQQQAITRHLAATANGSVQRNLTNGHILNLELVLPSRIEQRSIAAVLCSLDNKIELLRKQNETLEQIAQAIFNEWFVKPTENGELPEGWRVLSIFDIADVLSGGTPNTSNSEYYDGTIPFFTPKDANVAAYALKTEKYLTQDGLENCNSILFPINTVFITARGTVGRIALAGVPMAMNQSCYALRAKNEHNQFFLYLLLKKLTREILGRTHGSVFQTITLDTFRTFEITIPGDDALQDFSVKITPLFSKLLANARQTETLSKIRDEILPRLMSGEIRV